MLIIIYSVSAVALYLADQWWAIDDIVKTSVPSREGLKQVIRSYNFTIILQGFHMRPFHNIFPIS